jgi:hypothetical protein
MEVLERLWEDIWLLQTANCDWKIKRWKGIDGGEPSPRAVAQRLVG